MNVWESTPRLAHIFSAKLEVKRGGRPSFSMRSTRCRDAFFEIVASQLRHLSFISLTDVRYASSAAIQAIKEQTAIEKRRAGWMIRTAEQAYATSIGFEKLFPQSSGNLKLL
jgi:hypothetical protein